VLFGFEYLYNDVCLTKVVFILVELFSRSIKYP